MSEPHPAGAGRAGVSEFDAIRQWVAHLPTLGRGVRLGPGHDVAILDPEGPISISTDTLVEGTHFLRDRFTPEDVGWKALAVALSDLVAARSEPLAAVVSVTVRRSDLGGWAAGVMRGVGECAERFGCPVVGGDTTVTDGRAVIGVTVVGRAGHALTRTGAVPGDLLQLSGETGWAAAALHGVTTPRAHQAMNRPVPRFDLLPSLSSARAAIDVSDGLLADAAHLAEASRVTLHLSRDLAPARLVALIGAEDAHRCAVSGGEDYEILAVAPERLPGFEVIGRVGPRGDFDLQWSDGSAVAARGRGWDHGGAP